MKTSILNLGKALNKAEQNQINGENGSCTPEKCAEEYNKTAFEHLSASSFRCENNHECIII